MPATGNDDLLAVARDMTEGMTAMRGELRAVQTYGTRNRRMIQLMAASVAFDVCLSVGLFYGFRKADHAAREATRAASSQVVACSSGNVSRDIQRKLWEKVLSFPPPSNETPAAKAIREKQTAEFQAYLNSAFAIQDCAEGAS